MTHDIPAETVIKRSLESVIAIAHALRWAILTVTCGGVHSNEYLAIQKEARDLTKGAQTASPAERQQIDQRADQLTQQLEQMGY